jgi:anti-anti-sigma factor
MASIFTREERQATGCSDLWCLVGHWIEEAVQVTDALFHRNGNGLVAVTGEIDMANVHEFIEALTEIQGDIAVDCANLTFIDSSGINALVQAQNRSKAEGSSVRLLNVSPSFARVLDILGLSAWFDAHCDVN